MHALKIQFVTESLLLFLHTDAPRMTIDPPQSPHVVTVGDRLLLYCIAKGFPIPTIQWYKNNTLIPQQSSPLYLASTDTPGTTVYTCEGKNNAGNMQNVARASITVTVKGMWMPDNYRLLLYGLV